MSGPVLVGVVAQSGSFTIAWMAAAMVAAGAATLLETGRRGVLHQLSQP